MSRFGRTNSLGDDFQPLERFRVNCKYEKDKSDLATDMKSLFLQLSKDNKGKKLVPSLRRL